MERNGSRPTIYDVARLAGVSAKTVSRVVNEERSVREETREQVRRAIAMLGFEPHPLASALRRGRTLGIVGLVIQDLGNPFYLSLAHTVETALRKRSFTLMVASASEDAVLERTLVDAFLRRGISGLILAAAPGGDHTYLRGPMDNGIGVVFVDRAPIGLAADWVTIDNERGGYLATRYLIQRGHQRILAVGGPENAEPILARVLGYRRALRESGVEEDPLLIDLQAPDTESSSSAVRRHLHKNPPPTGVFTLNNRSCLGGAAELVQHSEPIALTTFGAPEGAELFRIPVARVKYDATALAETAAGYLLDRIDGSQVAPRNSVMPVSMGEVAPEGGQATAIARKVP